MAEVTWLLRKEGIWCHFRHCELTRIASTCHWWSNSNWNNPKPGHLKWRQDLNLWDPTQDGIQDLDIVSIHCFKEGGRETAYLMDSLLKAVRNEGEEGKWMKGRNYQVKHFLQVWVSVHDFQCLFTTACQSYFDISWNSCCQFLFPSLTFAMTVNY